MPKRKKSYNFYVNLDNPQDTLSHAREMKAKLEEQGREGTSAYLHQELNEVLALYQVKDFIEAHKKAELLHDKAVRLKTSTSIVYFTAKTAAHCCDALASAYEMHLKEKEERSQSLSSLAPSVSTIFQAQRAIKKLKENAFRYHGIAARIQSRPEMAFLRTRFNASKKRKENSSEDDDCSCSSDEQESRPSGVCRWEETTHGVDDEYEGYYGSRYQQRRKLPEVKERKRHLAEQCFRYKVPK